MTVIDLGSTTIADELTSGNTYDISVTLTGVYDNTDDEYPRMSLAFEQGDGERIVEENADELTRPDSFEAVADTAAKAKRDAESVKDSVQSYRSKLHTVNERSKDNRKTADEALDLAEEALESAEELPSGLALRRLIREVVEDACDCQ